PQKRNYWIAATVICALIAIAVWLVPRSAPPITRPPVEMTIVLPENVPLSRFGSQDSVLISPDGAAVAFRSRGGTYLRRVDSFEPLLLPETAGAHPFWSPDGRNIGFVKEPQSESASLVRQRIHDGSQHRTPFVNSPGRGG